MHHLSEGDVVHIKGSGKKPYEVKKVGGVVSCSCPAWRNIGGPIDVRVCKHIRKAIDRECLLPQAHAMYDDSKKKPKKGTKGAPRKAAVKKETAPPVLLAHKWENEDPSGWHMSEKLDGVRAWWDGKQFLSRLGNVYHAPEWFKAMLPKDTKLDGELFAGRGKFQQTVSAVRKLVPTDSEWEQISYVIFDAPEVKGTFEERMTHLNEHFHPYETEEGVAVHQVCVLNQNICENADTLAAYLANVEEQGGEGVMLREPKSAYEEGRSTTLLKVKTFFDDEATVVKHIAGRGKHKGRLGALRVEWNGVEFKVGTGFSDKQRENPPSVGSKVTFRYQELSKDGVPRFPSFITARDYE